ncbi:MAG TPA: tyrosine--tRNA ligase [Patescibacteria group bacterium]|nr:tyrosine--tRNA ligase [Patescibacteria group bacterium]
MDKIDELLTRGVDGVYPTKEALEKVLRSGKKLKLYQGFDPTGTQLHIGHMVGFRKLRQWQDLGHEVIFLIGDGTGQAGDPSGKLTARDKFLTRDELRENAKNYVMQAGKIVRFDGENPVKILYNGDWLNSLKLTDLLEIFGHLSLQQLIERDLFQERIKNNQSINMREFIYPVLQGYDSVAMEVDLELGGSDQLFNMLVGRQLIQDYLKKEKFVMTTPLLADSSGRKIGKTEGNVIGLTDEPENLFGQIMALGDDVIVKGLEYLTDVPMEEVKEIEKKLKEGEHPMQFKKKLAAEIVKQLHGEEQVEPSKAAFESRVQKKELPSEIEEVKLEKNQTILDILLITNFANSKSDAKRLLAQGGVTIDNKVITDPNQKIENEETLLQVGKRKFVKLLLAS